MELFNVYSLYPVEPVRGKGCFVYDAAGTEYLDLYGGHAVISIGHAQPDYVRALSEQAARLGFYSNSVENSLQTTLAEKLGRASGYDDYSLQTFNPEDLGDSEVVLLALRERGGYGDTAEQEVGPYNPLVGGISADLIFYDNLEIPTSLPSVTFKCAEFTSLIPGEESLIPDTISLLSAGILRLNNLSPALVPGTNDRIFAYGIHGQAVGQYGGSSNLKYKDTSLNP